MNASSWPMFLLRTLNGAEMAPATAFKKVCGVSKWFENFHYTNSMVPSYWHCIYAKGCCNEDIALVPGTSEAHAEQLQARHEA